MRNWSIAGSNAPGHDGGKTRRRHRRSDRRLRITWGIAVAVLVVLSGAFTGPAPANAETMEATPSADERARWDCDASGGTYRLNAGCDLVADSDEFFHARFEKHGEHLLIYDCFDNNRATVAYVDILDTPNVDYTRKNVDESDDCGYTAEDNNLSITDGTRISLRVCSSQTSGARCSPTAYGTA